MVASKSSGFSLLETVAVSALLAVSTMGLASALVSGTALTDQAHRRMSQVATAENVLEQIRQTSMGNFIGVADEYDGIAPAAYSSAGFTNDANRVLTVRVPLSESSVPGNIDLDADGNVGLVDPADARVLVVEIAGANQLRLRTVVLDMAKLSNIVRQGSQDDEGGDGPVEYGETYP